VEVLVQKNDNLNAVIKVNVQKEDYLSKYENSLKEYSKKVEIKGFRKGKVPATLVKKMYGAGVYYEEVN
jgi:trigger factor